MDQLYVTDTRRRLTPESTKVYLSDQDQISLISIQQNYFYCLVSSFANKSGAKWSVKWYEAMA